MDFSNTTTKDGLIQICEQNLFGDAPFGTISDNPDRLQIFTNFINDARSRYATIALTADNSWQVDDSTNSDFPIATTDMVANQPDYSLNDEQIIVEQVEMLDTTGTVWRAIPEMDERQFVEFQQSLSQYNNNIAGQPTLHAKIGNSIYFYPTPNYSMAGGIKLRFKRPLNYYAVTDTTKKTGFNRLHDTYLSDYATWKYSLSRGMEIFKTYQPIVVRWEQTDIPTHYADRSLEHPSKLMAITRSAR
jgi:hypothetical protein